MSFLYVRDQRRGRDPWVRWREWLTLIVVGLFGAAIGAPLDLLSVSISEDYFVLGKGLDEGAGLVRDAIGLGAIVGFGTGVLVGGVLLMTRRDDDVILPVARRAATLVLPLALLGEVLGAVFLPAIDPFGWRAALDGPLGEARAARFLMVHSMHLGLYGGAFAGLILAVRRERRQAPSGSSSASAIAVSAGSAAPSARSAL